MGFRSDHDAIVGQWNVFLFSVFHLKTIVLFCFVLQSLARNKKRAIDHLEFSVVCDMSSRIWKIVQNKSLDWSSLINFELAMRCCYRGEDGPVLPFSAFHLIYSCMQGCVWIQLSGHGTNVIPLHKLLIATDLFGLDHFYTYALVNVSPPAKSPQNTKLIVSLCLTLLRGLKWLPVCPLWIHILSYVEGSCQLNFISIKGAVFKLKSKCSHVREICVSSQRVKLWLWQNIQN